jgi:hypothetical protein
MDSDFLRGIHPDTNLISLHTQDRNRNIVTDHQGFTYTSREDQHINYSTLMLNVLLNRQVHCPSRAAAKNSVLYPYFPIYIRPDRGFL